MGQGTTELNFQETDPIFTVQPSAAATSDAVSTEDIAQTRAEMSDTIAAIGEKLNPAAIVDQAKEAVPQIAGEVADHAKEAIAEAASNATQHAKEAAMEVVEHIKETLPELVSNATHNATQHAKEASMEVVEHIKETLPELVSNVAHKAVSGAITEAKDAIGGAMTTAKGVSMTIIERIKQNPLPAAVAGAGLYWLFQSSNSQTSSAGPANYPQSNNGYGGNGGLGGKVSDVGSRVHDAASGLAGQVQDKAGSVVDTVSGAASTAVDKVQGAASTVADKVQGAAGAVVDSVQTGAGAVVDRVQDTAHQSTDWLQQTLRTNPLVIGALALVAGAALGLSIPETEPENRLMGSTRDKLAQKTQETVSTLGDKVQNVAHDAIDAVKQTVSAASPSA